uniref:DNA-directed DNA polymerase n=1 Tax=Meloidogyne incognita TaxID=6306 RepID=A0A914NUC2_MELIC
MMPEKRRAFDKWYQENNKKPFLLDEELAAYCANDVEILMSALIAFRREFLEVTKRGAGKRAASTKAHDGIDVLREAMTIASACMRHFRTNHLKEHHLGLVPERGYDNADNQSKLALKFLNWYATENNVNIQTAYSEGGEKKIGNYRVDGWIEEQQLAIEVNGCAWHGCSRCYPHDNTILPNGKSAGKQRELDKKRMDFIKQHNINIEVYWECGIKNMLSGRTGPLKLFFAPSQGEVISYYDVTSLYPYINVTTKYPIGHPKVHIFNKDIRWTKPSDNKFELAILK